MNEDEVVIGVPWALSTKANGVLHSIQTYLQSVVETMPLVSRYMVLTPEGKPYLERFDLRKDKTGAGTYIHLLYESDKDRDPHNHPMNFDSTILHGGYVQHKYGTKKPCTKMPSSMHDWTNDYFCTRCHQGMDELGLEIVETKTYNVGETNVLAAQELHRLELLETPTVTLIQRGPKLRHWGFMCDEDGFMPHEEYIKKHCPMNRSTEL